MLTAREAAQLLTAADSIEGLSPIARALGFSASAATIDARTRVALSLDAGASAAAVCTGPGALRMLLVQASDASAIRAFAERTAGRLARRTPHVLWLLAITQRSTHSLALTAWSGESPRPRLRALVCDRRHIVDSDAETLRALAAASGDGDLMTHARWVELLGRETLTRRFYAVLHDCVQNIADSGVSTRARDMRELSLLHVSRLLFLAFLQAKGWLDGDHAFLSRRFDHCMQSGGGFHGRVLLPLFFGTLNTPVRQRAPRARDFGRVPFLNGGLFTRTALERAWREVRFSDEAYGVLLANVFGRYRFTAREDQATWSEAAVDPEMLGRAFEGLMAHTDRKATGTFFTPQGMVRRLATTVLEETLSGHPRGALLRPGLGGVALDPPHAAELREHLERLTVLDPSCGSGAFLVRILEQVAAIMVVQGDPRSETSVRRAVLTHSIFGVDANPTAVWLCELRLWLSALIDCDETDPARVQPLPNLDLNIRVGDALAGEGFRTGSHAPAASRATTLRQLRERYTRATGPRKTTLARELGRRERARALSELDAALAVTHHRRRELLGLRRMPTLFGERAPTTREQREQSLELRREAASLRRARAAIARGGALPFSWSVYFPDIAAAGGFGAVIGNPPWVRLHEIPPDSRATLRARFEVARAAPWSLSETAPGHSTGFGTQMDLAAVFLERACDLAQPGGTLGLLLPSKLWSSLSGAGARRIVSRRASLVRLEDLTDAPDSFDAAVYPSLLVARRNAASETRAQPQCLSIGIHHRGSAILEWQSDVAALGYDDSTGAPWILAPPAVRAAFDHVRAAGIPLAASELGAPRLGVKCGRNDAFVVKCLETDDDLQVVEDAQGRRAWIERALLRPLVRGDSVAPWKLQASDEAIIWTHAENGAPLPDLPPHASRWLGRRRRELEARTDARRSARWWTVFRTEAARCDSPRVVWCDMGRTPRAAYLPARDRTVPLNTCYVIRCREEADALALVTLLNSVLAAAWLGTIAEPARGGYRRYLGWTVSLLPVPRRWTRARDPLTDIGSRAVNGAVPEPSDVLDAVCAAYGIRSREVQPLLAWSNR